MRFQGRGGLRAVRALSVVGINVACATAIPSGIIRIKAQLACGSTLPRVPAVRHQPRLSCFVAGLCVRQPAVPAPLCIRADVGTGHWEAVDARNAVVVVRLGVRIGRVVRVDHGPGAADEAHSLRQGRMDDFCATCCHCAAGVNHSVVYCQERICRSVTHSKMMLQTVHIIICLRPSVRRS